jgi:hypothetical protein
MTKAIKSCIWNRTCEATTSTRVVSLVCIFYIAIVYSTKQNRQAGMQLVETLKIKWIAILVRKLEQPAALLYLLSSE